MAKAKSEALHKKLMEVNICKVCGSKKHKSKDHKEKESKQEKVEKEVEKEEEEE